MNPSSLAASQLFVIFVRKMKPILHILYNENGLSFMYLTYDYLWQGVLAFYYHIAANVTFE